MIVIFSTLSADKTPTVRSGMESFQNPPGSVWSGDEISQAASLCVLLSLSPGVGDEGSAEGFQCGDSSVPEQPHARDSPVLSGIGVRGDSARSRSSAPAGGDSAQAGGREGGGHQ